MPSVLAYVRKQTSNVLLDDQTLYRDAFIHASALYAIYYHGMKLLKLAENQPINIPNIPALYSVIAPANISQFAGTMKALKDYLSTSCALPFAWREYIRWRFGTMFKSEDTGKPGLISYSPRIWSGDGSRTSATGLIRLTADATVATYTELIEKLKTRIIASGRAMADFKLAYDDHAANWEVENCHHDAKEFNLRCNYTNLQNTALSTRGTEKALPILLDSRLDMNAAYQAVTLSTKTTFDNLIANDISTPFPVSYTFIHYYVDAETAAKLTDTERFIGVLGQGEVQPGWNMINWKHDFNDVFSIYTPEGAIDKELAYAPDESPEEGYNASMGMRSAFRVQLGNALAMSLQLHNRPNYQYFAGGNAYYSTCLTLTPLSYDMALVLPESIDATHTVAMRNLLRGNYKRKTPEQSRPETKAAVKDMVTAVTDIDTSKVSSAKDAPATKK
jgi:hypothetical protein